MSLACTHGLHGPEVRTGATCWYGGVARFDASIYGNANGAPPSAGRPGAEPNRLCRDYAPGRTGAMGLKYVASMAPNQFGYRIPIGPRPLRCKVQCHRHGTEPGMAPTRRPLMSVEAAQVSGEKAPAIASKQAGGTTTIPLRIRDTVARWPPSGLRPRKCHPATNLLRHPWWPRVAK
jgi:hypothetical protein